MAYNRNQARGICNKTEYALFASSLKGEVEKLPQARVQSGIKRSRTLRDKYRDLHKRQRLATRDRVGTKKGIKPDTNARTEQKAKLFAEVLARFEAHLKNLKAEEKAQARSAGAKKKAGKKKAAKKKVAKKTAGKKKAAKKKAAKKKAAKKKVAKKKVAKKTATKKTVAKKKVAKKKVAKKKVAKKKVAKKKVAKKATKKKATKKKVAKKSAAKKTAAKKATSKKAVRKKAGKKRAARKASTFVSEQAAAASKRQREQNTRSRAVMGHTSASTKRRQAKRDGGKKR
jgi:hypothetical protein